MNTRLQQFLAAENMSQAQFADSIKVARAGVSHIIGGRNKPSFEFIINTMKRYPELNIEWLLTGKGKMYLNSPSQQPALANDAHGDGYADEIPVFEDGLFSSQENPVPEVHAPAPVREESKEDVTPIAYHKAEEQEKTVARQRKATKIIVFYDDGTFQEF